MGVLNLLARIKWLNKYYLEYYKRNVLLLIDLQVIK